MTIELIRNLPTHTDPGAAGLLLESKFVVPAPPPFWVARPALTNRLAAGAREAITLVTGPAGSGKTQLAASWASAPPSEVVAWLTLEKEDDQASAFWPYLVEAIRRAEPSFDPDPLLLPSEEVERSTLARLAAELCRLPRPVALVLDGVSHLSGLQWAADLDFVLRHADRRLRLVLLGRWDPPLPLHRYRLAGALTEIRTGDLAFTAEEAVRLLALHDVTLGEDALRALMQHTEGWAAGLRLFASALQGRDDPDAVVTTLSGDDTAIAEYFVAEVLRRQPPEVRRFLLETSILDTFTPELAEAVTRTEGVRRTLGTLARQNAFVTPVRAGEEVYRYHRLFGELLLAQLTWEHPGRAHRLHLRAAAWLAEQGNVLEAARHAARAGEWTEAATIVVADYAVGRLLIEGTRGPLGAVFRGMPDKPPSPELAVVRAALAAADGCGDIAADELAVANGMVSEEGGGCDDALRLAGLLVACQPVVAVDPRAAAEAIVQAQTLLAIAPASCGARHPELALLLLAAKASAQSRCGSIDAAAATLREAIDSAGPGCEAVKIECLGSLALIEACRGRLHRAAGLAGRALECADHHGLGAERRPVTAQLALAWVEAERYDIDAVDQHLRDAQPQCSGGSDGTAAAAYAIVKSRRLQSRGELRGAVRLLREAAEAAPAPPPWLGRENLLAQARLLIAAGHPDQARALIEGIGEADAPEVAVVRAMVLLAEGEPVRARGIARAVADGSAPPQVGVEAWLLLAMCAAAANDVPGAREALRQALRLAAPEAHRRTLHLAWTRLRRVLREDDELIAQYHALGSAQAPARPPVPPAAEPVLVEPLSKRELEVLRGMAAMLPTEEIAASMFVSINTVKTHVRSILRKLSASRRNEAVRRARALNVI